MPFDLSVSVHFGSFVFDERAVSITEVDPSKISPVASVAPAKVLVPVTIGCPPEQHSVDVVVYVTEDVLGRTGAVIVGPTPDNGVEF